MARFPMLRNQTNESTYICEQAFSILNLNKTKLGKKITDDYLRDTIQIATTKVIDLHHQPAIDHSKKNNETNKKSSEIKSKHLKIQKIT